jgi:homoserine kinase type II
MTQLTSPCEKHLARTIDRLLEEHYDIGRLTGVTEILGGYCNRSYAVQVMRKGRQRRYFLRLYNPDIQIKEIIFEHALINHLISNGFDLAAAIIPCRNGETMVAARPLESHRADLALWALFDFLEGENTYSWTHTDLSDKAVASAADVLARLHHCAYGFEAPPGAERNQPRIMAFIPTFEKCFSKFLHQAGQRQCDSLFRNHFKAICASLQDAVSYTNRFQGMPAMPVHCDYHPGNLKYRNQEVVGIFDFDWSKIDYRLFDLALGLYYFTAVWDGPECGLRRDIFERFLGIYNQACRTYDHIAPLSEQETHNLVPMLSVANLYVLNWDLVDFYTMAEPSDDEYIVYFEHEIDSMHWINAHASMLEKWVSQSTQNAL